MLCNVYINIQNKRIQIVYGSNVYKSHILKDVFVIQFTCTWFKCVSDKPAELMVILGLLTGRGAAHLFPPATLHILKIMYKVAESGMAKSSIAKSGMAKNGMAKSGMANIGKFFYLLLHFNWLDCPILKIRGPFCHYHFVHLKKQGLLL